MERPPHVWPRRVNASKRRYQDRDGRGLHSPLSPLFYKAAVNERLGYRRVALLSLRLRAAWTKAPHRLATPPSQRCSEKQFQDGQAPCRVREKLDDERSLLSCAFRDKVTYSGN